MKNIESILKEAGIELTAEQAEKVTAGVKENYRTISDYQKQVDKITSLEGTLSDTKEQIAKLENVDEEGLKKQIAELTETITKNQADFEAKLADRDFQDAINKAILGAKGKNAKAISALLDLETLRGSKNQQKDIEEALKGLAEAEDSKMLFGEPDPTKIGEGNPIGTVKKDGTAGLSGVEKAFYERTGVKID